MIEDEGKYYLYRHIRLDKNEVFYVGIGTKCQTNSRITKYQRAYNKAQRNKFWKSIINKIEYRVEIILESEDYEFIKEKEKEFIKLYGRKDLKEGTLCNLTNGDEGEDYKRKFKKVENPKVRQALTSHLLNIEFESIAEAARYLKVERSALTYAIYHTDSYQLCFLNEARERKRLHVLLESKLKMGKRISHSDNPSSKYLGVTWCKVNKNWKVMCNDTLLKKKIHIGVYDNEEEAGAAYQKYVEEMKQRIIEDFNKIYNKNCGS